MNLRRPAVRTAVAGVSTALAAGALVGIAGTTANAVENTTTYACSIGGFPIDLDLEVSTSVIPPTATAGRSFAPVPGGVEATITIPEFLMPSMTLSSVYGARADDYALTLGATTIEVPLQFGALIAKPDGSGVMSGAGAVEAFAFPSAGTYEVALPSAFVFAPTTLTGGFPRMNCSSTAPGHLGSVKVAKADSALKAKVEKAGKKYRVVVKVVRLDRQGEQATGKVTAKYGKRKVAKKLTRKVRDGRAVIKLPRAAMGKKVKLTYAGDGYLAPSKGSVKIKKPKRKK